MPCSPGPANIALRESPGGYALYERSCATCRRLRHGRRAPVVLDDIVITGGAGAIGLHYARYFAEHGARRIVLLSRRAAEPERARRPVGPTRHRAGVAAAATSPTLPNCHRLRRSSAPRGASLIVHAAGSAELRNAVGARRRRRWADAFAAKVGGLARMAQLWPVRPDTRMMLCSSVSGVWGGRGHVAYSAANRMLDVMAGQLRAGGQPLRVGAMGPVAGMPA